MEVLLCTSLSANMQRHPGLGAASDMDFVRSSSALTEQCNHMDKPTGLLAHAITVKHITRINIILGILFGVARTSFQSVLDPAGWLAGAVTYPEGSVFLDYFRSIANIQVYFSAALLKLGISEYLISLVFCCIACVFYLLFWQNVVHYFLMARANSNVPVRSFSTPLSLSQLVGLLAIPQLLLNAGFLLFGLNYEIIIPPGQVTFGPFAIIWCAWSLSLFLKRQHRWAVILIGLSPLIHPYIGLYFSGAVLLACLLMPAFSNKWSTILTITSCSLLSMVGLLLLKDTNSYATAHGFFELLECNISKHRLPLSFTLTLNVLCLGCILLACSWWRFARPKPEATLFLLSVAMLVGSALLLGQINNLPLDKMSGVLRHVYNSIPTRNANILYLLLCPLAFAWLSTGFQLCFALGLVALNVKSFMVLHQLTRSSSVVEGLHGGLQQPTSFYKVTLGVFLMCLLLQWIWKKRMSSNANKVLLLPSDMSIVMHKAYSHVMPYLQVIIIAATFVLSFCFSVMYANQLKARMTYYNNDDALHALLRQTNSPLLVAGAEAVDRVFVQSRTRRALVHDIQIPSTFSYLSQEPSQIVKKVRDIFQLDLMAAERKYKVNFPCDGLRCPEIRSLFSSRDLAEWLTLSQEYGFQEILVPNDWHLQLPLIASSPIWRVYRVSSGEHT